MRNKLILLMMCIILLTGSISGAEGKFGTFKSGENIELLQTCADCTFNNITSVIYSNSSTVVEDVVMTKQGTRFNYTLDSTLTRRSGKYLVNGVGDIGGTNTIWVYEFEVTPLGTSLEISETLLYVLLTIVVGLLFLLCLFFALRTPYSNEINGKGAVIKVTKTKYVKIGLIMFSYLLFVWFLNTLIGISLNFLNLTLYFGLMSFLFNTLNNIALPFSIFMLILMFFEIIRDANINDNIKKFGEAFR